MIPILYDKDETGFTGNGLGRLRDCTSCMVTEERNGIYECDFDVPVDGAHFSDIQIGRIVGVTHEGSDDIQPFDIVSYTRPIDGVVTFHCTHISYRQNKLTAISSSTISSLSQAFVLCKAGSFPAPNPFSYWSDIAGSGYFPLADGLPHSVRSMLGGTEGSILDTYGGEYEFDKFNVRLWASRGQDRDFTIRYGVNMTDFNDDTDLSETYNAVIPYWASSDDKVVGSMVTSGFTVTGRTECVPLDVSDKFEDKPTQADVEAMAQSIMSAQEPTKPQKNITVSFLRLQDLPEYQDFADIMTCKLCDTINVVFPDVGQSRFKIVKTVWNVLENRYDEMELGALSTSLSEALGIQSTQSQESLQTDKSIYAVLHSLSSDLSLSTTAKKVPLTTLGSYKGCQLSSNGVKVGDKGIYVIEGSAYFSTGFTANDLIHLNIYVNSSSAYDVVDRAYNASPYKIFVTGEVMVSLNADDVVYLYARNQTASRGTVGDHLSTRLTLHRIALLP